MEITDFVITFADKYTICLITFINHPLKITTMAKGNMLLGYSRGSVGDVTFYRSGGSQRSRARNRNPNNPRTEAQQVQRSKFANAVKFYKQVTTNFFRFAYEDKKTNESDYNAFMRHNVKNSGYIGAEAAKIANWPALGAWEVTNGSLPTIEVLSAVGDEYKFDVASSATSALTTIGALTTYLIANDTNYREGDIITALIYTLEGTGVANMPTTDTSKKFAVGVGILQFTLDSASTKALNTITTKAGAFDYNFVHNIEDGAGLRVIFGGSEGPGFAQVALIHSRQTAEGLMVSTQEMIADTAGTAKVNAALASSGTYYNAVIADWNASAEAILQGAASAN